MDFGELFESITSYHMMIDEDNNGPTAEAVGEGSSLLEGFASFSSPPPSSSPSSRRSREEEDNNSHDDDRVLEVGQVVVEERKPRVDWFQNRRMLARKKPIRCRAAIPKVFIILIFFDTVLRTAVQLPQCWF